MRVRHTALARPLACLAVALACTQAQAAPDAASPAGAPDTLLGFLSERGLAATDNTFAQTVRSKAGELVISAMNFLGVPYRRGGNDADSGFDCSGFTRHIFQSTVGLLLPRRVDDQASAPGLVQVRKDELQPGDLVFFNTLKRTFSHVGIYVGEGKFIHSPRSGGQVRVEDMRVSYWAQRFTGARRAPLPDGGAVEARASLQP